MIECKLIGYLTILRGLARRADRSAGDTTIARRLDGTLKQKQLRINLPKLETF